MTEADDCSGRRRASGKSPIDGCAVSGATSAERRQDSPPSSTVIIPFQPRVVATRGTSSETDEQLLVSWLDSLSSKHSRRNFETTGRRFLAALPNGLRGSTIEDVRAALDIVAFGTSTSTAKQYVLRAKSLMTYAEKLGYMPFNAGAAIKVKSEGNRGAELAKRIISETEVALLIRYTGNHRDKVMLQVLYASGMRVSELVGLNWGDLIARDRQVQLNVLGKGDKLRQVLLPENVSQSLLSLRYGGADADPVFVSRECGRVSTRNVVAMIKRAAHRAGLSGKISPHWLRHAHGSHAIDRGATIPEVQATLGHASATTTSGYLHARPNSSSGMKLDPGVFGK
jgi:integrase/recombinase XerD